MNHPDVQMDPPLVLWRARALGGIRVLGFTLGLRQGEDVKVGAMCKYGAC